MDSSFDLSPTFIGEYPNSMDLQLVENVDLAFDCSPLAKHRLDRVFGFLALLTEKYDVEKQ